jgi:hypothetical protein
MIIHEFFPEVLLSFVFRTDVASVTVVLLVDLKVLLGVALFQQDSTSWEDSYYFMGLQISLLFVGSNYLFASQALDHLV